MATFERRWIHWSGIGDGPRLNFTRQTLSLRTAKTDKRPFVGFGSPQGALDGGFLADLFLPAFARAGLTIEFDSAVLGRQITFASDNVPREETEAFEPHVFREPELRKLRLLRAGRYRPMTVLELVSVFGGTLRNANVTRRVKRP